MKRLFSLIILFIGIHYYCSAASQIILINAEPYLVDLNEDYDVEKVYHKVPDYFSNPETHEEILAHEVQELNRNSKLTSIDDGNAVKDLAVFDDKEKKCIPNYDIAPTVIRNSVTTCSADANHTVSQGVGVVSLRSFSSSGAVVSKPAMTSSSFVIASRPRLLGIRKTLVIS